jgi:hypothetical protein
MDPIKPQCPHFVLEELGNIAHRSLPQDHFQVLFAIVSFTDHRRFIPLPDN